MEVKTEVSGDTIDIDGEIPVRDRNWVAPEVSRALSGEKVEFGKTVVSEDDDNA